MVRRFNLRLAVLLVSLVALIGLAVALVAYQRHDQRQRLIAGREQALNQVQQGQYAPAIEPLARYLGRIEPDDPEVLLSLARALVATAQPDDWAPLVRAARHLRRLVSLRSDSLPAHEALLDIYDRLRFDEQVVQTADRILTLRHDHVPALRAQARALARLGQFPEAIEAARRGVAVAPHDLTLHQLLLEIRCQAGDPPQQILAEAQSLHEASPDDPRGKLLLARAYRLVSRSPEAVPILRDLADREPPDPAYARALVEELERVDLFDPALALLERSAARYPRDVFLQEALARRLWERGKVEALLSHLEGLDPADAPASVDLVAFKAMGLVQQGRWSRAEPLIDVLRNHPNHRPARAWALYLASVFEQDLDPDTAIRRCRAALKHDPDNPYIRYQLGHWLDQRGDVREALECWLIAARGCPAWALPRLHAARAMLQIGLEDQAVTMAEEAAQRSPQDLSIQIVQVLAQAAHWRQGGEESPAFLLQRVEQIQQQHPQEPRTLPLYVDLLVEAGRREDAGSVLLAALDKPLPAQTLIDLAQVSREHGLGLSQACYAQCAALHGPSSELTYAQAIYFWRLGRVDAALAGLIQPQQAVGDSPQDALAWQLAKLRFLDEIGEPEALEQWRALVEAWPDQLAVQRQALQSRAVQADRVLRQRIIDRLRVLTGQEGLAWRIAQARWLLESPQGSRQDIATAAMLLGQVIRRVPALTEPRLLLARGFDRLDNPQAALAQLRTAAKLSPHARPIALELARLLLEQGEQREALALLQGVIRNKASSGEELQQAAVLLIRLRDWDKAAAALTRSVGATRGAEELVFMEATPSADAATPTATQEPPTPLPEPAPAAVGP